MTVHPDPREFPQSANRRRIPFGELRRLLAEDFATNRRSRQKWTFFTPGFQALLAYRLGVWCNGLGPRVVRAPLHALVGTLSFFVRNFYGIELYPSARIGRRLRLAHQHGIVINPQSIVGDDCVILHGVTFGGGALRDGAGAPRLGDRVRVGAGAVLVGPVRIGDDVVIGPNAVVMTDVPAGSIVTAPPARIMTRPPRRPPAPVPVPVPAKASADGALS